MAEMADDFTTSVLLFPTQPWSKALLFDSIGSFSSHFSQFPLLGKLTTKCAEIVDQVTTRLNKSVAGGHFAVCLNTEFESATKASVGGTSPQVQNAGN